MALGIKLSRGQPQPLRPWTLFRWHDWSLWDSIRDHTDLVSLPLADLWNYISKQRLRRFPCPHSWRSATHCHHPSFPCTGGGTWKGHIRVKRLRNWKVRNKDNSILLLFFSLFKMYLLNVQTNNDFPQVRLNF